ncbi:YqhR family membrane protein [Aeribacillus alveayuensis]|uniref:YqhR family membrane protein n=1 Tax=Aeribacillus alveayuensis TaxID=279215 RepID=UPI0005D12506|nr:YqhR family membrane protein [Bacillus alveayuensis]
MTDLQNVEKAREEGKENQKLEQNQKEPPMSIFAKVMLIGFIGGVFWSFIGYIAYIFHFTKISPNLILTPFAVGDWKYDTIGNVIGILLNGLMSILVALLYYVTLKKFLSLWSGILFGVVLWVFVFYVLTPIFPNLDSFTKLDVNTNVTSICMFILFGVFVGYSISFEHNELTVKKQ